MSNQSIKILSFDVESCTGNHKDGSMCSLGYYLSDGDFNVIEHDDILMNPLPKEFRLSPKGKKPLVNLAYSESVFRSSPRFSYYYERIKALFESVDYVIGFAVINDVQYLNNSCEVFNKGRITYRFVDVQLLVKKELRQKTPVGLTKICEKWNIEYVAHRSDEDARVTLKVLEELCKIHNCTLPELLKEYSLTAGVNGAESTQGMQERDKKLKKSSKKPYAVKN